MRSERECRLTFSGRHFDGGDAGVYLGGLRGGDADDDCVFSAGAARVEDQERRRPALGNAADVHGGHPAVADLRDLAAADAGDSAQRGDAGAAGRDYFFEGKVREDGEVIICSFREGLATRASRQVSIG